MERNNCIFSDGILSVTVAIKNDFFGDACGYQQHANKHDAILQKRFLM
jgi:hypothetical protein